MTHPLVILGSILIGTLVAFFVGVWLLGWVPQTLHVARLRRAGRLIAWADAVDRLTRDADAVLVFEALARRAWLLTGPDAARFCADYDNNAESAQLAAFLETRGQLVHPLPCAPRSIDLEARLHTHAPTARYVFLDTDFAWGMAGMWKRFAACERRGKV